MASHFPLFSERSSVHYYSALVWSFWNCLKKQSEEVKQSETQIVAPYYWKITTFLNKTLLLLRYFHTQWRTWVDQTCWDRVAALKAYKSLLQHSGRKWSNRTASVGQTRRLQVTDAAPAAQWTRERRWSLESPAGVKTLRSGQKEPELRRSCRRVRPGWLLIEMPSIT